MTDADRIVAALESLGGKLDRIDEKLDAMARADIADRSDNDVKTKAVRQFVSDVLHIKDQVNFLAATERDRAKRRRKIGAVR